MRDLVYDVGVNDGWDSAYYLHRGFKVIGVEASPIAAEQLRVRFAAEIADGSFTLLNVGIAEEAGEFPFWVCEDHPEWSSFDRGIASRLGCKHYAVTVATRTFADIVRENGKAHFCKIDIEGNDRTCLESMTAEQAPPYISIEMGHGDGDQSLSLLSKLGYQRFKIISQSTWAQPVPSLTTVMFNLPRRARRLALEVEKTVRGRRRDGAWRFRFGSSGPFGEATPGKWLRLEEALSLWRFLRDIDAKHGTQGLGDWYDIHAKL